MAFRTWLKVLLATLGVGALAGASQLGLAYGLGIVRLTRVVDVPTRDQWTAQLAWVAWFAMVAAVVGALAGSWLLSRQNPAVRPAPAPSDALTGPTSVKAPRQPEPPAPGVAAMIALALAGAIGAGVVAPLTMQPARTAQIAGVNAVVVIGICAGLGAIVGIFAAYAALAQAVARWNLATVSIAVWVVALISVSPALAVSPSHASSDPLPAVRLGVFDAGFLTPAMTQRTALFTMPAIALLAGALLGWRARRQERPTLTIALTGLPGAALLTLAYLIAGPGTGADRYQIVPYWAAMTAAGAGVLGSVLAAVLRRGPEPDADDDSDPAPGRSPLPRNADEPEPAAATAGLAGSANGASDFNAPTGQMRSLSTGSNPPAAHADHEPAAFDGFARGASKQPTTAGRAQHAAPEQSAVHDNFAPRLDGQFAGFAPAGFAAPDTAKPYVPEPATRPLPPEVLSPPAGGGALSRGLRSLGRSRPTSTAPVDLPLPAVHDRPSLETHASAPEPKRGRRSRRGPLVAEPQAISAPLPQPTPIVPPPWHQEPPAHRPGPAPAPGAGGFSRTRPAADASFSTTTPAAPRVPGDHRGENADAAHTARPGTAAPSTGRHGEAPANPSAGQAADGRKGRRFGLKKRKENNDYVDWVSGLSND